MSPNLALVDGDIGDRSTAAKLVDTALSKFGRIDVLINNAGLSPLYASLVEHTEDLFDKVIAVNLKGPFRLSALFGSKMKAGIGGAIINVSSVSSIRPSATTAPYSAAKAGLNAITVAFANEYGPKVRRMPSGPVTSKR